VVSLPGRPRTFNKTAKGSQKWVPLHPHPSIETCLGQLKARGFRIYGTHLSVDARDYRDCDFTGPSCFLMGAEKWGMSDEALAMVDQPLFIPMTGMVQSLNVSVAAATLLFEALRQRDRAGVVPSQGEGIPGGETAYRRLLFEWAYPQVADWCRREGRPYPALTAEGEIAEPMPRTLKLRY
jgi:tRNA (guanosine-2'-O-)-methyltransferase